LSDNKIKKLELIKGWFWGNNIIKELRSFDEVYEQINIWCSLNNRIPSIKSKDKTEKYLGSWASERRKAKKKSKLDEDTIKKLELIKGWYWSKGDIIDTTVKKNR
jgi:hypothetical protein